MNFKNIDIEQKRYKFTITGNEVGSNRHVRVIYELYYHPLLSYWINVKSKYIEDQEIAEHLEKPDAWKLHEFINLMCKKVIQKTKIC